jgi:hypothetical protein
MDPSGSGGGGDENHLRIGDFVLLNINRLNGFLWGDGILRDDCKLQRSPEVFDNCVFKVVLRSRVSAAQELQEHQQTLEQEARAKEKGGKGRRQSMADALGADFVESLKRVKVQTRVPSPPPAPAPRASGVCGTDVVCLLSALRKHHAPATGQGAGDEPQADARELWPARK